MAQLGGSLPGAFRLPQITETDLFAFHEAHFGACSVSTFSHDFFNPNAATCDMGEEQAEAEEEDDGLGYYPDGVKRTLTDEQIAIFRHSELQTLRREQENGQAQRRRNSSSPMQLDPDDGELEEGEMPDNEGAQAAVVATNSTKKKKQNKKKKKRGSGNSNKKQWEPDPERRKRTWDVVEAGLDVLAYDDMETSGSAAQHTAQRRRITYDDEG
ncbi:hypothetical protein BD289DRAFT_462826 [Coniella lustricola]|uniref:Uncharacterized protein n=1 Tax=Coniella lustricola TaxID=2025994 RepID=A0A2T2ZYX1_9PEZI|nr:hypothetical protein BD289DRAFT_462826 [Coniella lustricola]